LAVDGFEAVERLERGAYVSALRNVGAITLFVEDLPCSKSFYRDIFGLAAVYEDENSTVFDFGNTLINLLKIPAARGLIEPRSVASPNTGSCFQLTIWVDDADAVCGELTERGVTLLNGPIDRAWGKRTASFTDPDGNIWEIAQELS
jgi:catechol 2,3-dioxygenase-like lactoylglutathione lyase family enzyme